MQKRLPISYKSPNHKFYIEIDDGTVIRRKCRRLLNGIQNDKDAMNDIVNKNDYFLKGVTQAIKRECNAKEIIKMNSKWNKDYKKQGYKIMSSKNIYKKVCSLLNKIL